MSINNTVIDENHVTLLTEWLDQLNQEGLITITDQNDIVIMTGRKNDQDQQIFVNSDHIDAFIERKMFINKITKKSDVISMSDIARILLQFGYVNESSGQLSFAADTIMLDTKQLKWLRSIIRDVRLNPKSYETEVRLFDGVNTELLCIPYEHMTPTNDPQIVANYLFRNGHIRYDVNSRAYAYRYIEPDILLDEKIKSPERISQHQFLSFHIRKIHVDQVNKRIELQFRNEYDRNLVLPFRWYDHISDHRFDRDYIIDILLANGGVINRNTFVFMGHTYSLQAPRIARANSVSALSTYLETVNLSSNEKYDLIRRYIDLIIAKEGTKFDKTLQLLVLENDIDGRQLYFTPSHTQLIQQNRFKREDVIQILMQNGEIKQDEYGNWLLYYNNQYIRFPSSLIPSSTIYSQNTNKRIPLNIQQIIPSNRTVSNYETESIKRYHNIIDYMYRHGFITWDKPSKLIKLHFIDQTLLIPIDHLRSITDSRILSSSSNINDVLPFTSRQLSNWLINNSYLTRKNY